MNTMLDAAIWHAAHGLRVHPLAPGTKDQPLLKEWQNRATTDLHKIAGWWADNPMANCAVACGQYEDNYLFILDIDVSPDRDGRQWLSEHQSWIRKTWAVKTGGNGLHLYYFSPVPIRNSVGMIDTGVGLGVDVRGIGGYGVGVGSTHPSGKVYISKHWTPGLITRATNELLEAVTNPRKKQPKVLSTRTTVTNDRPTRDWLIEWALRQAQPGCRNFTGYKLARQLIANGYDNYEGEAAMLEYQQRLGGDYGRDEAIKSWRSAHNAPVMPPMQRTVAA